MRLTKVLILGVLSVSLLGCVYSRSMQLSRASLPDYAIEATAVYIEETLETSFALSVCAAIPVSREENRVTAVTPAHLIEPHPLEALGLEFRTDISVTLFYGGESIPATVVSHPEGVDIIVIEFLVPAETEVQIVSLAEEDPNVGSDVFLVGHPGASHHLLLRGLVAGFCRRNTRCLTVPSDESAFVIDRPAYRGNSGGPVFNDSGELVGMLIETVMIPNPAQPEDSVPAFSIAMSISSLRRAIDSE